MDSGCVGSVVVVNVSTGSGGWLAASHNKGLLIFMRVCTRIVLRCGGVARSFVV